MSELIDGRTKGIPGGVAPFPRAEIGRQGWNLLREDLPLPLAVLKRSALDHNGRWMRGLLEMSGAAIAPHGKTTMSPDLFARQLADGAWAITVATVQQLLVCREAGIRRIVLANQLVGRQAVRTVLDELRRDPEFEFYCLVDSAEGAEFLARAAREAAVGRPLQLLLEGGYPGGRTGVRGLGAALATARAVKAAEPVLALRGVEGFEGLFTGSPGEVEGRVESFLGFLVEIARECATEGLFAPGPIILSAGGSAFYDLVVKRFRDAALDREVMLLTRSGCYLTHDSAMYRRFFAELEKRSPEVVRLGEGPRAALEVWAYVQSVPEAAKAILALGKRDVSPDEMPVGLAWYRPGGEGDGGPAPLPEGHVVTALNDQHAHMTLPAGSPLRVGDMVAFGVSHPCLTFDKWQVIPVVDDAYTVVDAVRTFF
jgi:D-serine dehydratase